MKDKINEEQISMNDCIIDLVVKEVNAFYQLPEISNKRTRKREYVKARQIAYWIIKQETKVTLTGIAKKFGYDHATVLHGINSIKNLMQVHKEFRAEVEKIHSVVLFKIKESETAGILENKYYYVNLEDVVCFRHSSKRAIVLTGYTDEEIKKFAKKNKLELSESKTINKTGLYILNKLK